MCVRYECDKLLAYVDRTGEGKCYFPGFCHIVSGNTKRIAGVDVTALRKGISELQTAFHLIAGPSSSSFKASYFDAVALDNFLESLGRSFPDEQSESILQEIQSHQAACSPLERSLGSGKITFGSFALFYTSKSNTVNQQEVKQASSTLS